MLPIPVTIQGMLAHIVYAPFVRLDSQAILIIMASQFKPMLGLPKSDTGGIFVTCLHPSSLHLCAWYLVPWVWSETVAASFHQWLGPRPSHGFTQMNLQIFAHRPLQRVFVLWQWSLAPLYCSQYCSFYHCAILTYWIVCYLHMLKLLRTLECEHPWPPMIS